MSTQFSFHGDCLNPSATLAVSRHLAVAIRFSAYTRDDAVYALRISQKGQGFDATIALGSAQQQNRSIALEHELTPMSGDYTLTITLEHKGKAIPGRWGSLDGAERIAEDSHRGVRTMSFEFTSEPGGAAKGGVLELRLRPA